MKTKYLFLFAMALNLLGFTGCVGGGGGDDSGSGGTTLQENSFSAVIDETGGTLEVTDSQSSIYGAKIIIPSGALPEEQTITINVDDTDYDFPENLQAAGEQIEFTPDGLTFETSVAVCLPYSDSDSDGVIDGTTFDEQDVSLVYFNEQNDEWEDVSVLNRNLDSNLVEADLEHFSTYLVVIDEEDVTDSDDDDDTYWIGEYFVGEPSFTIIDADADISDDSNKELVLIGCVGQDSTECTQADNCRTCGSSYVLTITNEDSTLGAVIDRFTTNAGGVPVSFNEDGTSISFDPTEIFEKVKTSGDAGLWEWRCDFIVEHTHVTNFEACESGSDNALCNEEGSTRYYPSISVVSENEVKIDYGIDLSDSSDVVFAPK